MTVISSIDLKRQILMGSMNSPIRKKMMDNPTGVPEGELIEQGNDLEAMTKTKGWTRVEMYIDRVIDINNLIVSDDVPLLKRGIAKGLAELMQWVKIAVDVKDKLLEKERLKYETKTVSEKQESEGV